MKWSILLAEYNPISDYFERHIELARRVRDELSDAIQVAARAMIDSLESGGKILLCGNGGSAADAQHIAAELTGRFIRDRRALPAVALTTDSSALTAISNDFGFDQVFARQVQALAKKGDILLALSTSGNSENLVAVLKTAAEIGCVRIALLGRDGGRMKGQAEHVLIIPSDYTPHIQEMHITIGHLICDLIDRHFA